MSHRTRILLILGIIMIHALALIGYRDHWQDSMSHGDDSRDSPVIMVAGTQLNASVTRHVLVRDPELVIRVHDKGFTGRLWKGTFPVDHPELVHQEPDRYLPQPAGRLGKPMVDVSTAWSQSIAPLPLLPAITLSDPNTIPKALPATTQIVFSSSLEDRKPILPENLPQWHGTELLPRTTIEVAVNANGLVESARLGTATSSSQQTNPLLEEVIPLVKQLRFAPLPTSTEQTPGLWTWGWVEFLWGSPPPGGNQPSQPPATLSETRP